MNDGQGPDHTKGGIRLRCANIDCGALFVLCNKLRGLGLSHRAANLHSISLQSIEDVIHSDGHAPSVLGKCRSVSNDSTHPRAQCGGDLLVDTFIDPLYSSTSSEATKSRAAQGRLFSTRLMALKSLSISASSLGTSALILIGNLKIQPDFAIRAARGHRV